MSIKSQKIIRWIPYVNLVTVIFALILLIKKRFRGEFFEPFVKGFVLFSLLTLPSTLVEYFFYKEWLWNLVFFTCFYFQLFSISTTGINIQRVLLEEKEVKKVTQKREEYKIKGPFLPRYGRYSHEKYTFGFYLIIFYVSVSILQKRIDIGALILAFVLMALQRMITHKEFYYIKDRSIISKTFFKRKTILLPEDIILIIARGNTLAFPYRRFQGNNGNLIEIEDCYMVCIVDNCTPREVLNMMRWNKYSEENRYSNVFIREVFLDNTYSDFLYSFVFDLEQVQKLTANHNCQIILPKSLEDKVDLRDINVPIHIDEEG